MNFLPRNDNDDILETFSSLLETVLDLSTRMDEYAAIEDVTIGVSLLGYENVMISMLDTSTNQAVIRAVAAEGAEWEKIKGITVREYPGPDILAKVLSSNKSVYIPDSRTDPNVDPIAIEKSGIISQYVIPLATEEMKIGTMQVHMRQNSEKPIFECMMLDTLARHLSVSISRLRLQKQLQEAEDKILNFTKFALVNEFASIIVHQLKEEVTDFYKVIEKILLNEKIRSNSQVYQQIKALREKAIKMSIKIKSPLQFSITKEDKKEVRINAVVQEIINNWHTAATVRGCKIKGSFRGNNEKIYIRPSALNEAFSCLILNSLQASANNIWIMVESDLDIFDDIENEREECVSIKIMDDGKGIPFDIIQSLFELGSTSKYTKEGDRKTLEGTGMGMFIVKRLVENMRGNIILESPGKTQGTSKTIFKITIPTIKV